MKFPLGLSLSLNSSCTPEGPDKALKKALYRGPYKTLREGSIKALLRLHEAS